MVYFVATVTVAALASVRKFEKMDWLAWLGFGSAFVALKSPLHFRTFSNQIFASLSNRAY